MSTSCSNYDYNILSCGYLRTYEHDNDISIPKCLQTIIATYCKYYMVYSSGCNDTFDKSNKWNRLTNINSLTYNINNIYANEHGINLPSIENTLLHSENNKTPLITSIAIAPEISDDKHIFISTTDNKLYKSKICTDTAHNSLTNIDTNFLQTSDTIIDIQSGLNHTLLLSKFGNAYSLGYNDLGQCGFNRIKFEYISTPKLMATNIKAIACGTNHSLLLNNKHQLIVCGDNYCGALGIVQSDLNNVNNEREQKQQQRFPVGYHEEAEQTESDSDMEYSEQYVSLSDNSMSFEMLDSDDETEDDYMIDEQNILCIDTPTVNRYFVDNNIKINKICAGTFHSLCIATNGKCYTFGMNVFGNLGNEICTDFGEATPKPQEISIDNEFIIDGSCGENHNMLLTKNNNIISFGDNSFNQCSMINKNKILSPYIMSKKNELGIDSNCYIEKVICFKNKSLIFIDQYKRQLKKAI